MRDLSLHLLDILENSAKAGARRVRVHFAAQGTALTVRIGDDGPGLPPQVAEDPTDPFRTTRRERKAGLGLSLLRTAAERTGGRLELGRSPWGGLQVTACFDLGHIDAKPVGDLAGALATAMAAWPGLDIEVAVTVDRRVRDVLDTAMIRRELDGVSAATPVVQRFLCERLAEELAELMAWATVALGSSVADRRAPRKPKSDER